jgi:hypothetical protein
MALKKIGQLPAFNGIPTAGTAATATLDVPRGPRYHSITLKVSDSNNANASTIIDRIRVVVNGKDQRTMTIAQLDEINSQNNEPFIHSAPTARFVAATSGGAVTTSITPYVTTRSVTTQGIGAYSLFKNASNVTHITIFFNEKWRPGAAGANFAWPTGNVASFQIEVDIAAAAGTVTMSAEAEMDLAKVRVQGSNVESAMPMGKIVKWYVTTMEVNGTTKNWTTFPYRRGQLLAVHWFDQYITNLQLLADNYEWRNHSQNDNLYRMVQNRMTGASTRFDLHIDYDDVFEGGVLNLANVQDLRFNLTLSDGTARNVTTLVQVLDDPD